MRLRLISVVHFVSVVCTATPTTTIFPAELFEEYCDRVIHTSDWGGQLELRALACALETPIQVFSAESDVIAMGEEFLDNSEPLQLTYHLHYYTLGEHFNSVTPAE